MEWKTERTRRTHALLAVKAWAEKVAVAAECPIEAAGIISPAATLWEVKLIVLEKCSFVYQFESIQDACMEVLNWTAVWPAIRIGLDIAPGMAIEIREWDGRGSSVIGERPLGKPIYEVAHFPPKVGN